jgi:hypothetical protein
LFWLSALERRLEETSNSPEGIASVHDNHASNIDLNAQARTEMSSNPFMWMFNMPNQQDFLVWIFIIPIITLGLVTSQN